MMKMSKIFTTISFKRVILKLDLTQFDPSTDYLHITCKQAKSPKSENIFDIGFRLIWIDQNNRTEATAV